MNQQHPVGAGARGGGSAGDNDSQGNDNHDEHEDTVALLLDQLYAIAAQGGYAVETAVCETKARNVLEATAGNVPLAAQLYWDDFLVASVAASQHLQQQQQRGPRNLGLAASAALPAARQPTNAAVAAALHPMMPVAARHHEGLAVKTGGGGDGESTNNDQQSVAVLRRRLEHKFNQQVAQHANEKISNKAINNKKRGLYNGVKRPALRGYKLRKGDDGREQRSSSESSSDSSDNDEEEDQRRPQPRLREQQDADFGDAPRDNNNNNININNGEVPAVAVGGGFDNHVNDDDLADVRAAAVAAVVAAESVSVSDDEAAMMAVGWSKFAGIRNKSSSKSNKTGNRSSSSKSRPSNNNPRRKSGLNHSMKLPLAKRLQQQLKSNNKYNSDDDSDVGNSNNDFELLDFVNDDEDAEDNENDGYLSENDWLWDALAGHKSSSGTVPPMNILWGGIPSLVPFSNGRLSDIDNDQCDRTNSTGVAMAEETNEEHINNKLNSNKKKKRSSGDNDDIHLNKNDMNVDTSNMIASDDDNHKNIISNVGDRKSKSKITNNDTQSSSSDDENIIPVKIPYTWLNAGFQFSEDGFGLTLQPPREDDLGYSAWKSSSLWRGNSRNAVPPPYHCRAVTALLSIVNGLLYTGACVTQKGKLSTGSAYDPTANSRKPLSEVCQEQEELEKQQLEAKKRKEEQYKRRLNKLDRLKDEDALINSKKLTKRELEARLTDALTSLLVIAVRASVDRKRKVLEVLRTSKDPAQQRNWQKLECKLRLCPVGWYDPDNMTSYKEQRADNSNDYLGIAISYTNIDDIREYVSGNLSAFMSSGGCALFLETIIRIHGKGSVIRMIRKARKQAGIPLTSTASYASSSNDDEVSPPNQGDRCQNGPQHSALLVFCTCEKSHKHNLETNPGFGRPRSGGKMNFDTTPASHECISIEMISLLLTGRVYSTLQGWSTGPLGLGLLSSDMPGQVGKGLTRPEKPVWILRGPTSYSCLWLNGCNDHADTFSKIDHPGSVAVMTHWHCWYGERNKTKLRLVTNRTQWHAPPEKGLSTEDLLDKAFGNENDYLPAHHNLTMKSNDKKRYLAQLGMLETIVKRRRANAVWVKEIMTGIETLDEELIVSAEEMNNVVVHPDDQKFYPNKYHLWRYQSGLLNNLAAPDHKKTTNNNEQQSLVEWKPFHRLTDREQLIVETKFGPRINTLLRTRWPRATMDRFEPQEPAPIV